MSNPYTRVIKVGGSLFDLPDLGERLQAWLDRQSTATNVLLAGGGAAVDKIRSDPEFPILSEREAHWKCIEIMTSSAECLSEMMSGVPVQSHVNFVPSNSSLIFSAATWLKNMEPLVDGTRLQESWDVTSDSIAARLAICIGADELVLLKSADPPSRDLQKLADLGYVDKFLPKLAGEFPLWRIVNFRNFASN